MSEITDKDLLGVEEVAGYLGVGPVTVYRWCHDGRLPCLKLGKHRRIRRAALEDFIRRSERQSALTRELRSFLNVLSTHVAIIDGSGTIVAVNEAWRDFARSNGAIESKVMEGANYLRVCDPARGVSPNMPSLLQMAFVRCSLTSEKSLLWSTRVIRPPSSAGSSDE